METNEKALTGEESLKIISEMINRTKVNIRQGSFHLLLWGWLIFICSLGEYVLFRFTDVSKPWIIWLLVVPGAFVSFIYGYIKGKKSLVHTYADMVYMWTWMGYFVSMVLLFIIQSERIDSLVPYILILTAVPTFISGFIIRFRPLIVGAIFFWFFALVAYFTGPQISPLALPAAMLTGYLIPGYMLKNKVSNGKV
jgi:hypothetical protein